MNKKVFNFNKKKLSKLYCESGLTLKEIGKMFDCSDGTIKKYLLKYGIKVRKPAHLGQTDRARVKISLAAAGRKASTATKDKLRKKLLGKFGEHARNWQGGKSHSKGYVIIKQHGHPLANHLGYVQEQVLVMEKKIGRHLKKGEVIHHINRKRDDNRIENLMLFPSQSKHIEYHNRFDPINR